MNKQISTWIGISIIVVVAIIFGGIILWMMQSSQFSTQSVLTQNQIPKTSIAKPDQNPANGVGKKSEIAQGDFLEAGGHSIAVSVPPSWGKLVVPQYSEDSEHRLINSKYATVDRNNDIYPGPYFQPGFAKMFSDYSYGKIEESNAVPSISLSIYPIQFSNDGEEKAPCSLKKVEYERDFVPLIKIYQQKGLGNIDLSKKNCFGSLNDDKCTQDELKGLWWFPCLAREDRVATRYFENKSSTLRGIGFFELSGQDVSDSMTAYNVILIDPEKRLLVSLYLPINGMIKFASKPDGNFDFEKTYKYLENPENYKSGELGRFMGEAESLVSSIQIEK